MIDIKSPGNLGNRMFQHCFARILEQEFGYDYNVRRFDGLIDTYTPCPHKPRRYNKTLKLKRCHKLSVDQIRSMMSVRGGDCDLMIKCTFEFYPHYKPYKELIRNQWLRIEPSDNFNHCYQNNRLVSVEVRPDDIVCNLRLGTDVVDKYDDRLLGFDYFDIILKNTKWNRLFLTSDNLNHPIISQFAKYNPILYRAPDPFNNFHFMFKFNKIAISQSTYSWWAAYLSNANEVYYPLPIKGPWTHLWNLDLRVDDDPRYIYVDERSQQILRDCKVSYTL